MSTSLSSRNDKPRISNHNDNRDEGNDDDGLRKDAYDSMFRRDCDRYPFFSDSFSFLPSTNARRTHNYNNDDGDDDDDDN